MEKEPKFESAISVKVYLQQIKKKAKAEGKNLSR
jgi:hypothetical protein